MESFESQLCKRLVARWPRPTFRFAEKGDGNYQYESRYPAESYELDRIPKPSKWEPYDGPQQPAPRNLMEVVPKRNPTRQELDAFYWTKSKLRKMFYDLGIGLPEGDRSREKLMQQCVAIDKMYRRIKLLMDFRQKNPLNDKRTQQMIDLGCAQVQHELNTATREFSASTLPAFQQPLQEWHRQQIALIKALTETHEVETNTDPFQR